MRLLAKNPDKDARNNPKGPPNSYDPDEPGAWKKVTRGGSFMCSDNYCRGYRPSARMKTAPDTGLAKHRLSLREGRYAAVGGPGLKGCVFDKPHASSTAVLRRTPIPMMSSLG